MNLEELANKIEKSNFYKVTQKHRKFILIIQGLFIIGLLISINIYVYQDHFLKKQIAENCGYETQTYRCVCNQKYVEEYENDFKNLNFTIENYGKLDR